ncbi:MAG: hypothetical protein AAB885_02440 [Patescibacteria group bacterium]
MRVWLVGLVFLSACVGGETIVKENNPVLGKGKRFFVNSIRFYEDENFSEEVLNSKDSERIKKIVKDSLQEKLKANGLITMDSVNESEASYRLDIQAAHTSKFLIIHWIHSRILVSQSENQIFEITSRERVYGRDEEEIHKVADKLADEIVKILVEKLAPK